MCDKPRVDLLFDLLPAIMRSGDLRVRVGRSPYPQSRRRVKRREATSGEGAQEVHTAYSCMYKRRILYVAVKLDRDIALRWLLYAVQSTIVRICAGSSAAEETKKKDGGRVMSI